MMFSLCCGAVAIRGGALTKLSPPSVLPPAPNVQRRVSSNLKRIRMRTLPRADFNAGFKAIMAGHYW